MKWLTAVEREKPSSQVTKIWHINPNAGGGTLGEVRWFSAWRKYTFFPFSGTLYDPACLRDLADFCEQQTTARKLERER